MTHFSRTTRTRRSGLRALTLLALGLLAAIGVTHFLLARAAHAEVADFTYDSWSFEADVLLDADGRPEMHVTETLVARFPEFDQNRGIVRGIPADYEGAPTDPRDFEVTDGDGQPIPFEVEEDDGFVAVLTGDDDYVHGVQTYVISYTVSDMMLARDDGTADEFYWDLLDFEHLQPVEAFSATIRFSPELARNATGNAVCYFGEARSDANCEISAAADGSAVTVAPLTLGAQEGLTLAVGFAPGTAVEAPARVPNFALDTLPLIAGGGAIASGGIAAGGILVLRRKRRSARGVVIAQYEVPRDLPPLIAAPIIGGSTQPVSAQFVHLAVNGAIRIEEAPAAKRGKPRPMLRLIDPNQATDPLDAATLSRVFHTLSAQATFLIPKDDEDFGKRMTKLEERGAQAAIDRGYLERQRSRFAFLAGIVALCIGAATLALAIFGLLARGSGGALGGCVLAAGAIVLGLVGISKHRVHTELGAQTREYLAGVREFISVAEADRLRMLQSYTGAERTSDGEHTVIHLYERLLPYAMLFGLEKKWAKVLETSYSEHSDYSPNWYPGLGVLGLSGFTSTISQFTSSLNSSVSYTSSSSGGSTGGGFAGGGGGGGFSGGR